MPYGNTIKKNWKVATKLPDNVLEQLKKYRPIIAQLLYNRGIKNPAEAELFFNPNYNTLLSPFVLTDMDKAVTRTIEALLKREKITIYADYDADAVTAATVLWRGLRAMGAENLDCYIPDRFAEGYGVNMQAIEEIAKNGTRLVITVDCGINSIEEIKRANKLDMDVVVTDHHHITDGLPEAFAVVNHHRDGIASLSGLTGVGTAFKFLQALLVAVFAEKYQDHDWQVPKSIKKELTEKLQQKLNGEIWAHWEKWLLDLVAIGTIADCQSVMGENRTLVKYGLSVLSKSRWIGLRHLLLSAGLSGKPFDTFMVGFMIAPRINAAGRIQHADIAFKLLSTDDLNEAQVLAGQLESLNQHRQRLTEQIFSEARSQVELQSGNKVLVAVGDGWPKGVVGLVASRISEEFWRPTVVLERSGDLATGSARSIGSFNLVEAFTAAKTSLVRYGGHAGAAGLSLKPVNISEFHQTLLLYAENQINTDDLIKQVAVEVVCTPSDLTLETVKVLRQFEPFGPDNPAPTFLLQDLTVESVRGVGTTGKHLRLSASSEGQVYTFIGFGFGPRLAQLSPGQTVDMVVEVSENSWNGRTEVQRKIIDLKIKR